MDRYGYIGIETLLRFCENSKDHSVTPNDFMRMPRKKMDKVDDGTIMITVPIEDLDATGRIILEAARWCKTFYAVEPPRMKGKWKTGLNENGVTTSLFCSECNYENKHWYEWNFCPHCGADMRKEEHDRADT